MVLSNNRKTSHNLISYFASYYLRQKVLDFDECWKFFCVFELFFPVPTLIPMLNFSEEFWRYSAQFRIYGIIFICWTQDPLTPHYFCIGNGLARIARRLLFPKWMVWGWHNCALMPRQLHPILEAFFQPTVQWQCRNGHCLHGYLEKI